MSIRFRRRVRIAPGVHLNLSKSGIGVSAGPRGAKIGVGPRGVHHSVGIPGTGLHYRRDVRWKSVSNKALTRYETRESRVTYEMRLEEDGRVEFVDAYGEPHPPRVVRQIRAQEGAQIQRFLEAQCEQLNGNIDAILNIHLLTPNPADKKPFKKRPFKHPRPVQFIPQKPGMLGLIWPSKKRKIEEDNTKGLQKWQQEITAWEALRKNHAEQENTRWRNFEQSLVGNQEAMESVFEEVLAQIAWPRETLISYQVEESGSVLCLDIDLPEVEDMPRVEASIAARGVKINIRNKSDTQIRKEYMQHIHGVVFRIIGESFSAFPALTEVIASGYSQRPDPATGAIQDHYLISVRVSRSDWNEINFSGLDSVDLVKCFERFNLHRKVTKTGIFTPIDPIRLNSS